MSRFVRSSASLPHVLWPLSMSWRLTSFRLSTGAPAPLAGALAALTAPVAGALAAPTAAAGAPPLRALSIDAAMTGLKTEPS